MKQLKIRWTGHALGKNDKQGRTRPCAICHGYKYFTTTAYKEYIAVLAKEFVAQRVYFGEEIVDVTIRSSVGSRRDHHNLIEPILDALQQSGAIKNDKQVGDLHLPRPLRHGNSEDDVIEIEVQGAEYEDTFFNSVLIVTDDPR